MDKNLLKLEAYRLARKIFINKSVGFNFEITTRCNLGCKFCTHGFRDNRDMDWDTIEGSLDLFIKLIEKYNIKKYSVCPVGVGESTLHPDFFKIINRIDERLPDAKIYLNTNLYNKEYDFIKQLMESPIDIICVSLRFSDSHKYRNECGVEGFDNVFESLLMMSDLNNIHHKDIHCQLFTSENNVKIPGVKTLFENRIDFSDRGMVIRMIKKARNQVVVDVDGHVYPCCLCVWYDGMEEFENSISLKKHIGLE